MLSTKFGIKPREKVLGKYGSTYYNKIVSILQKFPYLLDFQRDAIIRTAFAQDCREVFNNGQVLSLIDSYVGSGKTIISLLGGILYTLKQNVSIKQSFYFEKDKYFYDLHPRCSPFYCKGYRNIVAVCANHDLVYQWEKVANQVIFSIQDVVKEEFNKDLRVKVTPTWGKLEGDLKEYDANELIILIMKQKNEEYSPKFLYNENSVNEVKDHFDKRNFTDDQEFNNIACSVLIADEAHLKNSVVNVPVKFTPNHTVRKNDRYPLLLASHVIAVSASLFDVVNELFYKEKYSLFDYLLRPHVLTSFVYDLRVVLFKQHIRGCIRCDNKMLEKYYENIHNVTIGSLNLHVPKGLGESEFEITNPQFNFKKVFRNDEKEL